MSRIPITIALQLEILPNFKIAIPGCEPTSSLSSRTLSSYMAINGCSNGIVDVQKALDAIPGSTIKTGSNFNRGGFRQRWFVFPPVDTDCPCDPYGDWYNILKTLVDTEEPVEESFDKCDVTGMGFCPSPDWQDAPAPPADPYRQEGVWPAGVGVLPPIPPWQQDSDSET